MDLSSDIGIHPHSNKKSSWNSLHTALELLQTLGSELWFTNDYTYGSLSRVYNLENRTFSLLHPWWNWYEIYRMTVLQSYQHPIIVNKTAAY